MTKRRFTKFIVRRVTVETQEVTLSDHDISCHEGDGAAAALCAAKLDNMWMEETQDLTVLPAES